MPELPEEVLRKVVEEHLSLPSLCRFRCVSKAWATPALNPASLRGVFLRKQANPSSDEVDLHLSLYSGGDQRWFYLHPIPRVIGGIRGITLVGCVDGFLACLLDASQLSQQIGFAVCDIFSGRWTRYPDAPTSLNSVVTFAGISKLAANARQPRLGLTRLEDYLVVVATKLSDGTVLLQSREGRRQWSCGHLYMPPGHFFMSSEDDSRCGVLRGTVFYFLAMHSRMSAASLCCVDVLGKARRCETVCGVDETFVSEWKPESSSHPKLVMCSGKLLLLHSHAAGTEEHTVEVELLDEGTLTWKFLSCLPRELKATQDCCMHAVIGGGDELVFLDRQGTGYIYNLCTDSWSARPNFSDVIAVFVA